MIKIGCNNRPWCDRNWITKMSEFAYNNKNTMYGEGIVDIYGVDNMIITWLNISSKNHPYQYCIYMVNVGLIHVQWFYNWHFLF